MMSQEAKLEKWLRQQIFRSGRESPLEKFVLRSAAISKNGQEVDEFLVPESVSPDIIQRLRDDIVTRAQSDADAIGSKVQRYVLVALEIGAKTGPRYPMRFQGEGDDLEDGEDQPTEKGLLQQLMRHNETLMRLNVQMAAGSQSSQQRQIEKQEDIIQKLLEERQQNFEVLENSRSEQHLRDTQMLLAAGDEERKSDRNKMLMGKLEMVFPLIMNKLAGKNLLTAEEQDVVGSFVEGLSPEQMQHIARGLKPEQQAVLLGIIQETKARKAKAEKTSEPNGQPS